MKILLLGNPNTGKSVVFTRLTDAYVISSNYPGATVEFAQGRLCHKGVCFPVIDVPGTYTLEPTCPAEEVAVRMLDDIEKDDVIINVIDSTNIERSLNLTLQLIKRNFKMVLAFNMSDEAKHHGITIDYEKIAAILGVPCVPITAVTGEGIKKLVDEIPNAKTSSMEIEDGEHWHAIGDIIEQAVSFTHRHHTIWETIRDLTVRPITGLPIALIVLTACFFFIRYLGEGLIGFVFDPIFDNLWLPVLYKISNALGGGGIFHDILVGKLVAPDEAFLGEIYRTGIIHYEQSLGLLSTGLYVPLAMVLPYVLGFYLVLSFLEDSGYLPRLGVLLDSLMHKFGLHGLSIIPMMLGIGCNVPGVLATRILETKRERFIAIVMMSICIPCMSQIAVIFGLVGEYGALPLFWVFGTLLVLWILLGIVLQKFRRGNSPEIFIEIPPYRLPYFSGLFKKVWMRLRGFLREAVPFVLIGVLILNILFTLGVVDFLGKLVEPVITGLMGLPKESIAAIIIGFFRKDVAIGMLAPLGLNVKQLVIASVILTMYFPCIGTFVVILKELGIKDLIIASLIMLGATLIVGSLLNLVPLSMFV